MTNPAQNCGCWFEIPVTDLDASKAFYADVLKCDLSVEMQGPEHTVILPFNDETPGVGGQLSVGAPSKDGSLIHFMAPDTLDATRARVTQAGGTVESPDVEIPPGHFFYARDIDGNRIGFFRPHA